MSLINDLITSSFSCLLWWPCFHIISHCWVNTLCYHCKCSFIFVAQAAALPLLYSLQADFWKQQVCSCWKLCWNEAATTLLRKKLSHCFIAGAYVLKRERERVKDFSSILPPSSLLNEHKSTEEFHVTPRWQSTLLSSTEKCRKNHTEWDQRFHLTEYSIPSNNQLQMFREEYRSLMSTEGLILTSM